MALYENGKRISGIRDFPAYTWAEYHALPVAQRPKVWKCTDRNYTEIPPTYEQLAVTGGNLNFAISGNVVNVYSKLTGLSSGTSVIITTANPYKAPRGFYAVFPIYNTSGAYEPIGAAWIYSNGNIEITKPSSVTTCYISGTYIKDA